MLLFLDLLFHFLYYLFIKKRKPFRDDEIEQIIEIIESRNSISLKELNSLGFSKHKFTVTFGSYTDLLYKLNKKRKFVPENRKCKHCLKDFAVKPNNHRQIFCSKSCSNKINKVKKGLFKECICINCNKPFLNTGNKNIVCSLICSMEINMKKTPLSSLIKRTGANAYDSIRSRARTYSKYIHSLECQKCGYKNHYEVCHIKAINQFDFNTSTLWDVNQPSNLIHLCPNHHWELDNGIIGPAPEI